jgi:hypothetical protein
MTVRNVRRWITRRQLRSLARLTLLLITVLIALLAGCGQASMSGPVATGGSTAAPPTATSATINSASSTGCPLAHPPADAASFKPDVMVSQNAQSAGTAQPIILAQGQRLEIRLQSMFNWELTMTGASNSLAITSPRGWYDASVHACVWRFTAVGAGEVTLTYNGVIVCPPLKLCPSVEQAAIYRVTVR